jgi:hypothetical protein
VCAAPVSAITVKKAQVKNGALEVRGKEGAPGATITLDGISTGAVASGSGSFKASAVVLPDDCIVTVGDGVATVDAVVKNCGPVGAQGPQGEQGPEGPQGDAGVDGLDGADGGFRILDGDGVEVGIVMDHEHDGYSRSVYTVMLSNGLLTHLDVRSERNTPSTPQHADVGPISSGERAYFATNDCTGPAFVEMLNGTDENWLFGTLTQPYIATTFAGGQRNYLSYLIGNSSNPGCVTFNGSARYEVWEAVPAPAITPPLPLVGARGIKRPLILVPTP